MKLGEAVKLWHSPERKCFGTVPVKDHLENWELGSTDFKRWLAGAYYKDTGQTPGTQAMTEATGVLEQKAIEGREHEVYLRVAGADGKVYLDLGDPTWRAVAVAAEGWKVIAKPPVKFVRSDAMLPLPEPEGGASIDTLRGFLNVASEADHLLVVGHLLSMFMPRGPYPVLCLTGEQGSAKSTAARMLAGLVDPRRAGLRALPKDPRDLAVCGFNGWVLGFDNISALPGELADALCRMASGSGFAVRTLHTDHHETIFDGARPIILTAIPDLASRADLADRSLAITLAPIPPEARRTERALFADFKKVVPEILGALLDGVSSALCNIDGVEPEHVERMADFAIWVTAAEPGLGWTVGSFMEAYRQNRAGAVELAVESDPVASAIVKLVERVVLPWNGSAGELLVELDLVITEKVRTSRYWPGTPSRFAGILRRVAPSLRGIGIDVEFGDRASSRDRKRLIVIRRRD